MDRNNQSAGVLRQRQRVAWQLRLHLVPRIVGALIISGMVFTSGTGIANASDHLDTPTVIADPAADIGDLYAWTSSDGRRLNLVMDIVAHRFSDQLQYVFHVDSGERFGKTTASTSIVCRFDAAQALECWAGDSDYVRGDASKAAGLEGRNRRFRAFAGLRDDPFFNNVKGTRSALDAASAALKGGAALDAAGCPGFSEAIVRTILDRWEHTDGGPATNFLAGWKCSSLVISIDLDVVATGGKVLAVWAGVHKPLTRQKGLRRKTSGIPPRPMLGTQIERVGRPLIKNGLIGPLAAGDVSNARKEAYNRAAVKDWPQFVADILPTLGLYDGFDGKCGNQWLAGPDDKSDARYRSLANMLADDRLWVNSKSSVCTQYLAVELAEKEDFAEILISGQSNDDCGGRTPNYPANNVFRSLLAGGLTIGVSDGVYRDDRVHSTTAFPFLAAP